MIIKAVGGRAVAQVDPTEIGGINVTGADVGSDYRAVVGVAAPIQPAQVRAVGIMVGAVDGRVIGQHHRETVKRQAPARGSRRIIANRIVVV